MNKLIRCEFCNKVINKNEFGLNDKEIGTFCKSCFFWLNQEFLKKWGVAYADKP